MSSLNSVMMVGRLTRDPELKVLQGGSAVANLSLAINERYKKRGEKEFTEDTTFVPIEAWGKLAERCSAAFEKADLVLVVGKLKMDTWEKDGKKYSKLRVSAREIEKIEAQPAADRGNPSGDQGEREREQAPPDVGGGRGQGKPGYGVGAVHTDGSPVVDDDDNLPF